MNIFKRQTENAAKAYELRNAIPEKLKCYLDFRPKATGITFVSFFDFAPMRGLEVNDKEINSVLNKIKSKQDFLISPDKDGKEKRDIFKDLGFKARCDNGSEYLEEGVQAFLIREILRRGDKDMLQRIIEGCNFLGLEYLTSEFEWSSDKVVDRIDILCCDKENYRKVLVLELKKVRTTQLKQGRYLNILRDNEGELIRFISALTNRAFDETTHLDIHMIYLMPSHPRLEPAMWDKVVSKHGIDGIIFYNTGYPFDGIITIKNSECSR